MSSNGSTRDHPSSTPQREHERRALARRISRQTARDQQLRGTPAITLPRLACLDEDRAPPDVDANASRMRSMLEVVAHIDTPSGARR